MNTQEQTLTVRSTPNIAFFTKLKDKVSRPPITPFNEETIQLKGKGFFYKGTEFVHHSNLPHHKTAFRRTTQEQKIILTLLALFILSGLLINWHVTLVGIVTLLTVVYFLDLLFNLFLIIRSYAKAPKAKVSNEQLAAIKDENLPTYTIFCPLYREWDVLPQFISAMNRLDYPKNKLQVMLLLEEDDTQTIEKLNSFAIPQYFDVVIVPHSLPKTKPKALNYGLQKATGEYVVIYDAEDIPETDQLKKAVIIFKNADKKVICVQAKLNFYNPHQNIITRAFTAEYSLWFDLVLTGLQSIKAPIPLGGTSNHFRRKDLDQLKGWDSFNVTEDCDLGIRLVKNGYRTAIMESYTHEEANSDVRNWFNQRTRWIKGYMQTYLVHMRDAHEFIGEPHFAAFQLIVGGKVLSMLINPLMWVITISYFVFRGYIGSFIESFFLMPVMYMGVLSLFLGNFLYMYYYAIGCAKRGHDDLIKYSVFVPIYWLAMSIAAWNAVHKIIYRPHYWSKTIHGLHLNNTSAIKQDEKVVGTSPFKNNQ